MRATTATTRRSTLTARRATTRRSGRVVDGTELAGEVRFALGPAVPLEASRLALALRQLEQRFTDAHFVGKLCELAAVDRVAPEDEAHNNGRGGDLGSDAASAVLYRMQHTMLLLTGRGGAMAPQLSTASGRFEVLFARLAYGAARSFGWTRCGAHLLACAERMMPLKDERGAQVVAVELWAALGRASRRWPAAERQAARAQLAAFLRQHCILSNSGSGDGLDLGVEVGAALRFVANRCDARRTVWLGDALRLEWLGDGAHAADVGNASAQARALDLATTLTQLLEWRGAAWCARVQATVARGLENQALVRFSQVRIATARLIAATLVAARRVDAMTQRSGELVRQLIAGAAAQSELLELLLVVVLGDAALSPAFADELQHVVPVVLEGQRDNDPERATMARHAAALLMQYSLSGAQLDALLAAMHAQVANTGDAAAWQSRRVALPMLQLLAFRLRFDGGAQVNARVLEIGKLALLDCRGSHRLALARPGAAV
jgi:hypothetical protein